MLGLVSYSGSHVNRFDLTAYSKPVIAFHLTGDFTFRQRRLACLEEFIGGPAWILERFPKDCESYWVSISTDDFADLWGPLSLAEENDGPGSIKCIYTERGVITHVGDSSGLHLAKPDELRCHWHRLDSKELPLTSRQAPGVELSETVIRTGQCNRCRRHPKLGDSSPKQWKCFRPTGTIAYREIFSEGEQRLQLEPVVSGRY